MLTWPTLHCQRDSKYRKITFFSCHWLCEQQNVDTSKSVINIGSGFRETNPFNRISGPVFQTRIWWQIWHDLTSWILGSRLDTSLHKKDRARGELSNQEHASTRFWYLFITHRAAQKGGKQGKTCATHKIRVALTYSVCKKSWETRLGRQSENTMPRRAFNCVFRALQF